MAKKNRHSIWDDTNLVEAENTRSKPVQSSETSRRFVRGYTKLATYSFPLVLVMLGVIWTDMPTPEDFVQAEASEQIDSPGKAEALLAQDAWLESVPAPLSNGRVLSWDGFDVVPEPKLDEVVAKAVTTPEYDIELHHFTLVDGAGNRYLSDVAVAVTEKEGATALSTPSLSPIAPAASGWATNGAWYGLKSATPSDAVRVAVSDWAVAFTSGDAEVLGQRVGDEAENHEYMPLYGVASVEANVVSAASVPVVEDGTVSDAKPKQLVAQVELKLTWLGPDGKPQESVVGGGHGNSVITYDVLINAANTKAPKVVAWGGPGTGTSLKEYQNAVVDRELTEAGN
ncbi:hypothetical protein [Agromyces humi]|uniref:hypothetical protein n=1 Tax=Agromyces humi TaxID=1766800 RepID=UPI001359A1AD|nr:hypothetical protein [Agromyces humi]